jgi:RNAse (barnase) inhibitor barstar
MLLTREKESFTIPQKNMEKVHCVVDGKTFETLEGFFDEIRRQMALETEWAKTLEAFEETLQSEFNKAEKGMVLIWKNHHLSKESLGFRETKRCIEEKLKVCHHSEVLRIRKELEQIKKGNGVLLFDAIITLLEKYTGKGLELHLE